MTAQARKYDLLDLSTPLIWWVGSLLQVWYAVVFGAAIGQHIKLSHVALQYPEMIKIYKCYVEEWCVVEQ